MEEKTVSAVLRVTEDGTEIEVFGVGDKVTSPLNIKFESRGSWGYFRSKPDDLAIEIQRVFDYFCDGTTHRDRELVTILMDTWAKLKIAKVDAKLQQINVYNCSNERASNGEESA